MAREAVRLQIGATFTRARTYTQRDLDRFAALSGDDNPIHVDAAFARRTRFGRTVCHGMLLASSLSAALTQMLGAGWLPQAQELIFLAPVYTGEMTTAHLEVSGLDTHQGTATLATRISNPDGAVACQGSVVVSLPDAPSQRWMHATVAAPAESGAAIHKTLHVGQSAEVTRIFTAADLLAYRELAGDLNPAFSDYAWAHAQNWQAPMLPVGLLGGIFSCLLGTQLPGRGANWLKQSFRWHAPAFADQALTARVAITRLRPEKDLVNLACRCSSADVLLCTGESLVLVKDLAAA